MISVTIAGREHPLDETWGGATTFSGMSMAAPQVGAGGALHLAGNLWGYPDWRGERPQLLAVSTGTTSKDGAAITLLDVASF
ncbi:MAG TPA: hypothetical protein VES88_01705 [Gemmatimonadaceae bacterium]|nr:hypothetical protein [Gemmatimonadaceae bacterium]